MTVYFISGLGADKQIFRNLALPENWNIQYLEWLVPFKKEILASYCHRMAKRIDITHEFVLIGLSFGGIIAVELNKIVKPKLTILISSIATRNELPGISIIIAKTRLDQIVPASFLKIPNVFVYWFFGTKTSEEKRLLRQTIRGTSSSFLKWAIHHIINWNNTHRPDNLIHIHGTNDHLLPINKTKADIKIINGGHLMVYNKAGIISKFLIEEIENSKK